jgi:hypothetical protein
MLRTGWLPVYRVGDGGGSGDKHGEAGNGQNINTLLGKFFGSM